MVITLKAGLRASQYVSERSCDCPTGLIISVGFFGPSV